VKACPVRNVWIPSSVRAWLRYRRELNQIRNENAVALKPYSDALHKALEQGATEQLDELHENHYVQSRKNRDRLTLLETERLISLALKRLLPIPERNRNDMLGKPDPNSKWRVSTHDHFELILSRDSRRELLLAIRADRRERREIVRSWLSTIAPILGGITGIIGALIGLLTLIWRHQAGSP
jgi:hypothetical protein